MSESRAVRVAEQIQREVAGLLTAGKLKDDRIGFVTITGVDVTPDLMEAKIWYAVHGSDEEKAATADAFKDAAGKVRSHIGKVMRIRHAPSIRFLVDESIDRGERIEKLLKDVREREGW